MKQSILAAKINELINYAKHEYSQSRGLHLNSKDWESYIHVGNPQIYSFITNGTLIFYTVSKISGETYKQPVKLSEFKKIEAPLLLLYLIGANEMDIETFMIRFFSSTKSKIFCECPAFCLDENTNIDLVDGRTLTIKELYEEYKSGKTNYVYSIDKYSNPTINKVNNVWCSGKINDLIKITLDNGESIITTYDHYYILRNGNNIMAKELSIGDSLMPIYFSIDKNGYKYAKPNNEMSEFKRKSIHRIVAHKYLGENNNKYSVVHHIDYNKNNNNPENLMYMDKMEHIQYHASHINEYRDKLNESIRNWIIYMKEHEPETLREIKARGGKQCYKNNPEHYKIFNAAGINWVRNHKDFYSSLMTERWNNDDFRNKTIKCIIERWKNLKYKQMISDKMSAAWTDERRYLQAEKIKKYNYFNNTNTNKSPYHILSTKIGNIFNTITKMYNNGESLDINTFETYRKINKSFNWSKVFISFEEAINNYLFYIKDKKRNKRIIIDNILHYNHKIINIEKIHHDVPVDVYDMEIENDHNFYLSAGIVVHNSYWGPHYNLTQMGSAYGAGENRPPDIRDPKRKNIVCKHLWQVLKSYNGLIRTLVSELRPYYLRMFGIQSPKGIDRLKRQLGKKGFKKIIEQAINDISKTSDPLLVNIFNNLTKGKLNIVNAPAEKIDKIMKQSKDIPPILDTDKLQTIPELPEEIKPEEPIKEPEVTDEDVNEDLYSEMDLETPAKLKTEKEKEEQDKNKQQEQNEMYEKLKNKQVEFDPTALDSSKIIRAALRKY